MRASNILRGHPISHILTCRTRDTVARRFTPSLQTLHNSRSMATMHATNPEHDRANTIGFIGLGAMGNHMLNNLVTRSPVDKVRGRPTFAICDVNQSAVRQVTQRHQIENPGATLLQCSSPSEVAKKASTIITMVPTGQHVREVYLGENSVMTALKTLDSIQRTGTLCLDQSTIEQSVSKDVALKMKEVGAIMMDAPVSGGIVGARDGTLAIMVGGDKAAFDRSVRFLQPMARKVTHCGDLGAGLAAKIANNLLLGISMLGLSEAMLLGKALGIQPQVLADIINSSTGRCWSSEVNHPVPEVKIGNTSPPAHRDYEGGFVTKLAHKDLALAVAAAVEANVPLELGKRVEQMYRPLAQSGKWGSRDFSVIYEALGDPSVAESVTAKL